MKKVRRWPQPEEVPVSFSEPGQDDGRLPPVNIVIPDDARELDRDVIAYRRELRAKRRRQRFLRLLRPLSGREFTGHAAIIPLIAACLAISLVGGALLSVATMTTSDSTPTASSPQASASPESMTELPAGTVQIDGHAVAVQSLVTSAIAIIPANCGCGTELGRLATEAVAADVSVYFAGAGAVIPQLPVLTARYGDGAAVAVADNNGVLTDTYHPAGLTVLLVFSTPTAEVVTSLPPNTELTWDLRELKLPGGATGGP
jgi:hypothetical protein